VLPFIGNRVRTIQYALAWLLYAVLHTVSIQWVVPLPFGMLLLNAVIHTALFALSGILLWNVIFYGNYEHMHPVQQIINYSTLAVLFVGLLVGLAFGLNYLILGENAFYFVPVLPIYVLLGLMIYLILVLYFRHIISQIQINEESTESLPESICKDETAQNIEFIERISIKSGHKIHIILVPDIIYLQAEGDYVLVYTEKGKFLKEQTMKYFEENLPFNQFVRVHRSYIVNIGAISRIEQYEKQTQLLILKNGDKIKVSLAGYKLLKKSLGL